MIINERKNMLFPFTFFVLYVFITANGQLAPKQTSIPISNILCLEKNSINVLITFYLNFLIIQIIVHYNLNSM